jgi:hypothetical protein
MCRSSFFKQTPELFQSITRCRPQAQNETNVVFVPHAVQVADDSLMLGEIVISGQHESTEAVGAPADVRSRALSGSAQSAERVSADDQGEGNTSDMDMKSWSAMSSQKRSKVKTFTSS